MDYIGYVGTYTSNQSEGIYQFTYKDKQLSNISLFAKVKNPKYLTMIDNYIPAACDLETGSGVGVFDYDGNLIDSIVFEERTSCYIGTNDNLLFTANYHGGTATLLKFENQKLQLIKKTLIKQKAGCHQILTYQDKYLVPCLFLDKIMILNKDFDIVDEIKFEEGAGPRHGVFSKDEKFLYVVGELSNLLYVVNMQTKQIVASEELLENHLSHVKDTAAIRLRDDYLYVSTRTQDVISVIHVDGKNVKRVQVESCAGQHPRDFIIVDNEIIVANRFTNTLSVLPIKEGYVQKETGTVSVPEAVSIVVRRV